MSENEKDLKKATKHGIKVMRQSRKYHPMRKESRIVKYGAKGFFRNIWLSSAATIVMSITMIILFVTIVASVILTSTAEMMKDKIDITIYFTPMTSDETLEELKTIISEDKNIKSVVVSNSEQEYNKFIEEEDDEEIINIMDEEMKKIMISNMQATMRIKVYDIENIDSIKKIVEENAVFAANLDDELEPTYDVNQKEIATITSWAQIARTGGIVLAIVFLVISILIIFSTIRMAIFSRREEIYMIKLVGAEKGFIRGPFLIEAEICGVIAGIVAGTVSYFGFRFMTPRLMNYGISVDQITKVMESNQLILVFIAFIVMGVIIGRISAWLAVSKYLNKT